MKFVIAITGLLSLIPALVLGITCELCPNFDASLPIDMNQFVRSRRSLRILQVQEYLDMMGIEITSCGQLEGALGSIGSMGFVFDTIICRSFEVVSMLFCGCESACSTCPEGSAYPDLDAIPDYGALEELELDDDIMGFMYVGDLMGMEEPETCRELVIQMGATAAVEELLDEIMDLGLLPTGMEDDRVNDYLYGKGVDTPAMLCGLAGMTCGCQMGADKAEILDATDATTNGPPKGTSTETSDTSQMFALSHSTATATMLLAVFSWFLFV